MPVEHAGFNSMQEFLKHHRQQGASGNRDSAKITETHNILHQSELTRKTQARQDKPLAPKPADSSDLMLKVLRLKEDQDRKNPEYDWMQGFGYLPYHC